MSNAELEKCGGDPSSCCALRRGLDIKLKTLQSFPFSSSIFFKTFFFFLLWFIHSWFLNDFLSCYPTVIYYVDRHSVIIMTSWLPDSVDWILTKARLFFFVFCNALITNQFAYWLLFFHNPQFVGSSFKFDCFKLYLKFFFSNLQIQMSRQ